MSRGQMFLQTFHPRGCYGNLQILADQLLLSQLGTISRRGRLCPPFQTFLRPCSVVKCNLRLPTTYKQKYTYNTKYHLCLDLISSNPIQIISRTKLKLKCRLKPFYFVINWPQQQKGHLRTVHGTTELSWGAKHTSMICWKLPRIDESYFQKVKITKSIISYSTVE